MKLSETEHEIYIRFNQSNSAWVQFASYTMSDGEGNIGGVSSDAIQEKGAPHDHLLDEPH